MLIANNRRGYSKFESRLQNSRYFCVFKYSRVVKQKVWNKAENSERDRGEVFSLSPHTPVGRVRLLRHTLPFFFTDFEKKATVLQSRKFGAKVVKQNIPSCFITRMKHSTNAHIFQVYLLFLFIGCL